MVHNDAISNFSDAPISPFPFDPVRTSKRMGIVNKDFNRDFNFTPSDMSSGKKLKSTPKTPKTKFNKLEALRTPVLVKKSLDIEKEERRKLS